MNKKTRILSKKETNSFFLQKSISFLNGIFLKYLTTNFKRISFNKISTSKENTNTTIDIFKYSPVNKLYGKNIKMAGNIPKYI